MSETGIRVAVIGAGMAGRAHANAYRQATTLYGLDLPPVELVAIADVNLPAAEDAARRYGFERAVADWREIAEADDISAVSIVVGNELHREIAESLIAQGKHVLCEKPLAASLEDAAAMARAEAGTDLVTAVGYSYRRSPAINAVRELVRSSQLGDVSHFDGRYLCDYGSDPDIPISWRYQGAPGTGILADTGSHLIDIAEFVCGPIVSVGGAMFATSIAERPVPAGAVSGRGEVALGEGTAPVENEDVATFTATFANGAVGTFSVSRVAFGMPNGLSFEVYGRGGRAGFDMHRGSEFSVDDARLDRYTRGSRRVLIDRQHPYWEGGTPVPVGGVGTSQVDLWIYQARAFLEQVAGVRDALPRCPDFAHGYRSMRLLQAVADSAAQGGTAVDVD